MDRADLIELLVRAQELLSQQPFPRLMAAFNDAAERDPALQCLPGEITERRREPFCRVLVEAYHFGEIASMVDIDLAVDLLTSPAFYRRFIAHRPFHAGYAAAVVDHVLKAPGVSDAQ